MSELEKNAKQNEWYLCEEGKWNGHPYLCDPLDCPYRLEHILIELITLNTKFNANE